MKIIIASGGTLGHLTPILPVVKKLKEMGYQIILYSSKELNFDKNYFNEVKNYKAYGLTKNIYKTVFKNYITYKKLLKDLKQEQPNLLIGMGGYISGLAILAASNQSIKTIIHEQNSVIGTANKLVLKKVNFLIYSNKTLDVKIQNKIYLPNPRSEDASHYQKIYQKQNNQILIVSGSLGAKTLNEIGLILCKQFKEYNFILITGKRYFDDYKNKKMNNLKIIPRTNNLIKLICESKIVISRAGATTISEIIGSNTVGIYIPSPNVTKNHQLKNCNFIQEQHLGLVINEQDIKEYNISSELIKVIENYQEYQENLNRLEFNNVIEKYIKIIGEVISKK